jgi:uncharacterized coiled-coil protein SlyX
MATLPGFDVSAAEQRIAELTTQLAEHRAFSSGLADAADDLRAELQLARERIAELVAEVARLKAENAVIAELEAVIHDYDARIEQWLKPFPGTETCDCCGRAMGIGFHVDDETWARICPDGNTSAVLCPWCADKRAKELGLTDVPATFFIVFDVLRDSQEPYKGAWKQRALRAEAELAALKARRCETCDEWATIEDCGLMGLGYCRDTNQRDKGDGCSRWWPKGTPREAPDAER